MPRLLYKRKKSFTMYTCTKVVNKMFVCKIVGGGGGRNRCMYIQFSV